MRKFMVFSGFLLLALSARADYVDHSVFGASKTWNTDTVILKDVTVDVNDLYITDSIVLENDGMLDARIHIADGRRLYFRNGWTVNATYDLGNGAKVIQLVNADSDLRDIGGAFDILVQGTDEISLDALLNFADGRNITFDNSEFIYDKVAMSNASAIRLIGENIIYLDDVSSLNGAPVLTGLEGDGTALIKVENLDSMYVVTSYFKDGNLYGSLVRETDYVKVLGGEIGTFLNDLRNYNASDKLLSALDSATDRGAINSIISRSARLNPIKLMSTVRALNLLDMHNADAGAFNAMGIRSVFTDSGDIYGVNLRVAGSVTDSVSIGFALFAGTGEYSSDTDDAAADIISVALDAKYQGRRLMLRSRAGITGAAFDIGYVWDDGTIESNPVGKSFYALVDAGARFDLDENLFFLPFVGLGYDEVKIVDSADKNFAANIGADFGFTTTGYDINYEYAARVRMSSSGDVMTTLRIGVISEFDAAGGGLEFSKIYSDVADAYEIKLGVNFAF